MFCICAFASCRLTDTSEEQISHRYSAIALSTFPCPETSLKKYVFPVIRLSTASREGNDLEFSYRTISGSTRIPFSTSHEFLSRKIKSCSSLGSVISISPARAKRSLHTSRRVSRSYPSSFSFACMALSAPQT